MLGRALAVDGTTGRRCIVSWRAASRSVATIAQRGGGFIQEVKRRHDVEIWMVTQATRDALPDRIVAWIQRRMR
jgi:hypothetical protein